MSSRNTIMVNRTIYQIAVVTLVTALVWIGLGIYQALVKPLDLSNIDPAILSPINPVIDTGVIGAVGTRIKFDPNLPTATNLTTSPTPAIKTTTASGSATINKGKTK